MVGTAAHEHENHLSIMKTGPVGPIDEVNYLQTESAGAQIEQIAGGTPSG